MTAPAVRIGNQSAFSAATLFAPFDFAVQQGFDAFEWFPDRRPDGVGWDAADLSPAVRLDIRNRARDAGISLSVHAPIPVEPLKPNADRGFEESLRLAVDLGAGLLNIHFSEPRRVEEYAHAVLPWIDHCRISGVRLSLENIPAVGPDDFNRLFTLLPRTGVGMTLDVGHANLHGATWNDYIAYLDQLRPEVPIFHVHLHENYGDRDSHLVVFTGPAGKDPAGIRALLQRLRKRGYEGNVILEQWPDPPSMLVMARDRLNELLREDQT